MASKENSKISSALKTVIELKNEGNNCFVNNKYKEALDYYSQAIEVCPDDYKDELSKIYQNRAAVYEKLKNYERVKEECSKALKLNPNYQKALTRRSQVAERLQDYKTAIEDLRSLCVLNNNISMENTTRIKMLIKAYSERIFQERKKNFKPIPIKKYMVNDFYLCYTKDPVYENEKFYNELKSSKNPDEVKEMYNAVTEFNNENYEKCIEHCTNEIKKKGKFINEARNLRGSLYHMRKQYAEAVMDFNEITNNPKASNRMKANALSKIPGSLFNLEEYTVDKVVSIFKRAIELDPKNEDVHVARVALLPRIGCFLEFDIDNEIGIKLNPNNKGAFLYKAFNEYLLKYHDVMKPCFGYIPIETPFIPPELNHKAEKEARKIFEPLLEKYNDLAKPFAQFARALQRLQNYKEADKYFKLAIEREPKDGERYAELAMNHMEWKVNDYETPFKIFTEGLKVDDTCAEIYVKFTQLEIQYGKYQHAAELNSRLIDLRSNFDNEATRYLCSMFIVAQMQHKMVQKYGKTIHHLDLV